MWHIIILFAYLKYSSGYLYMHLVYTPSYTPDIPILIVVVGPPHAFLLLPRPLAPHPTKTLTLAVNNPPLLPTSPLLPGIISTTQSSEPVHQDISASPAHTDSCGAFSSLHLSKRACRECGDFGHYVKTCPVKLGGAPRNNLIPCPSPDTSIALKPSTIHNEFRPVVTHPSRFGSGCEPVEVLDQQRRCGVCGSYGHYKKTCKVSQLMHQKAEEAWFGDLRREGKNINE